MTHGGLLTKTYPYNTFNDYKYTVIFTRQAVPSGVGKGDTSSGNPLRWQWLYARHKERTTFETAGGRIEPGETPFQCAERELREETGAEKFHLHPAFDYTVHRSGISKGNGQAYLADVEKFGALDPTYEMAEIKAFDTLPDTMTYPEILPVLFAEMQRWLARNTPDEYWDLLDADRNPLGVTHKRGDPKPPGTYHTVVRAWVMNAKGEFISTRRCLTKLGSPGMWEITSGSAAAGETSRQAAAREVKEETGVILPPECIEAAELFRTVREENAFWDNWLFRHNFDLTDFIPQKGETMDAKAATLQDIAYMVETGYFVREELKILKNKLVK